MDKGNGLNLSSSQKSIDDAEVEVLKQKLEFLGRVHDAQNAKYQQLIRSNVDQSATIFALREELRKCDSIRQVSTCSLEMQVQKLQTLVGEMHQEKMSLIASHKELLASKEAVINTLQHQFQHVLNLLQNVSFFSKACSDSDSDPIQDAQIKPSGSSSSIDETIFTKADFVEASRSLNFFKN